MRFFKSLITIFPLLLSAAFTRYVHLPRDINVATQTIFKTVTTCLTGQTVTAGSSSSIPVAESVTAVIISTSTTVCPFTSTYTSGSVTRTTTGLTTSTVIITTTSTVCTKCFNGSSTSSGAPEFPSSLASFGFITTTSGGAATATSPLDCHYDNCLREFLQSSAIVASFCSTYTATANTLSTGLPIYVSQCSGSPSQISSACSCLMTSSSSPSVSTTSGSSVSNSISSSSQLSTTSSSFSTGNPSISSSSLFSPASTSSTSSTSSASIISSVSIALSTSSTFSASIISSASVTSSASSSLSNLSTPSILSSSSTLSASYIPTGSSILSTLSTSSTSPISSTSSTSSMSSASSKLTTSSSISSASPTTTACSFWLEDITHQGIAAFNSNPASYQVFRNIKDFGAKGDGVTDDTIAINLAISSGARCSPSDCESSTTTPALVYFPPGTYIISSPIIDYYYTQIIGNPNCMPVIKPSSAFTARWVIDGDAYNRQGVLGFGPLATNVFWRQIRNFVIDMTAIPADISVAGIHWPTAQATSLQNILFKMSDAPGTEHQGVFTEAGSGGFVTDLTFYGGLNGITVGNQQYTMRNLTFYNAVVAINQIWDWGWTYKGISINNCSVGLDITALNDAQAGGSVVFIDSEISDTPVGVAMARDATSTPPTGGSLILENVMLNNVPTAVQGPGAAVVLAGSLGESLIAAWGQGNQYTPTGPSIFQGPISPNPRPASLTAGTDFYEHSKPGYENFSAAQFVSVRDAGAKGDGVTDDSDALNAALASAVSSGKVVFFDAGDYLVTKTIYVPAGSKIIGESYPVILSGGSFFADMSNPQPVVRVGKSGEVGTIEWSDMIVSTQGAQAGAILIEWNIAASTSSPAGMWDVHTRVGGFAGSDLQFAQCPTTATTTITSSKVAQQCIAAYMSMHVTASATGLYMENCWLWTADHDVDDPQQRQITIFAGRGLLIESASGGNWLYGTAVEHHALYQYQLSNTDTIFMGQIQTETAYYQPNPDARIPFPTVAALNDPVFAPGQSGWDLRIVGSSNVLVYGAGLYSFFNNYDVTCSNPGNGEECQREIFSVENSTGVRVYNLNTVGTEQMIKVDGKDIATFSDNIDGFVDTVALFRV